MLLALNKQKYRGLAGVRAGCDPRLLANRAVFCTPCDVLMLACLPTAAKSKLREGTIMSLRPFSPVELETLEAEAEAAEKAFAAEAASAKGRKRKSGASAKGRNRGRGRGKAATIGGRRSTSPTERARGEPSPRASGTEGFEGDQDEEEVSPKAGEQRARRTGAGSRGGRAGARGRARGRGRLAIDPETGLPLPLVPFSVYVVRACVSIV